MIAFIANFLGVNKAIAWGGIAVIALGSLLIWIAVEKRQAVKQDRLESRNIVLEAVLEANKAAHDTLAVKRAENASNAAKTQKGMNNAIAENPKAARKPSGPVTNAVADSLRSQKD